MRRFLSADNRESGFTLIELMVTLAVFGILAAIAVPVYLSQRNAQITTSVRADTHNMAEAVRTALISNPNATGFSIYKGSQIPSLDLGKLPVRNVAQGQTKFAITLPIACSNTNPLASPTLNSQGTSAGYSVIGYNTTLSGYAYWFNSTTGEYYSTDSWNATTSKCTADTSFQSK